MKLPFALLLPLVSQLPVAAAESPAPSRQLIVAAVGEIPVARMKVAELMGRVGYVTDESSTNQFFPQAWEFQLGASPTNLEIGLNLEPTTLSIPEGVTDLKLKPTGSNVSEQQQKAKLIPAGTGQGPSMLVIFNREPTRPWVEGFSSIFTTCTSLDPAKPAAQVLNLSGAALTYTGPDKIKHTIAPGQIAVAPMMVNPQQNINMLPLAAGVNGKNYTLDVCPIDARGTYCPVVVVYPSGASTSKTRPLRTSVIQPSQATSTQKTALVSTSAPAVPE